MPYAFKKEGENGLSPDYSNKGAVIQDTLVFNLSPISPRKCRAILTRIVYLLYIGESLDVEDATTLFFRTTKLFPHKDVGRGCCVAGDGHLSMTFRAPFARWSILPSKSWLRRPRIP